ncbi:hypothetical protein VNO78_08251 [Psophocarpus tetragonolobus]|uniref:Uncharacterized protein n=1 Tax=Psophocarpus tetragonolobus TaxID=3891 RepID=A0AAN9SW43_PSOTE
MTFRTRKQSITSVQHTRVLAHHVRNRNTHHPLHDTWLHRLDSLKGSVAQFNTVSPFKLETEEPMGWKGLRRDPGSYQNRGLTDHYPTQKDIFRRFLSVMMGARRGGEEE